MLNLTSCGSPYATSWSLNADGHVSNNVTDDCLTTYSCGNAPGDTLFAYDCVTDACKYVTLFSGKCVVHPIA